MNELIDLQKRLIESGFRLLKRGGIMVYSTCSLSSKQNEQVVHWLLDKYKDTAYIIAVSFSAESYDNTSSSSQELSFIEEGSISGTIQGMEQQRRVLRLIVSCREVDSFLQRLGSGSISREGEENQS